MLQNSFLIVIMLKNKFSIYFCPFLGKINHIFNDSTESCKKIGYNFQFRLYNGLVGQRDKKNKHLGVFYERLRTENFRTP